MRSATSGSQAALAVLSLLIVCHLTNDGFSQEISVSIQSVVNSTDTPANASGVNAYLDEHFWFASNGNKVVLQPGFNNEFPIVPRLSQATLSFRGFPADLEDRASLFSMDILNWSLGDGGDDSAVILDRIMLPDASTVSFDSFHNITFDRQLALFDCGPTDCTISFDIWYIDDDISTDGTFGLNNLDDGSSQAASPFELANFRVSIVPEPSTLLPLLFGVLTVLGSLRTKYHLPSNRG